MTSNEIKSKLEFIGEYCDYDYNGISFDGVISEALEYINVLETENKAMHKLLKERRNTKNEAIKEFAEKLKGKALTKYDYTDCIDVDDIDNLIKEMVGEIK